MKVLQVIQPGEMSITEKESRAPGAGEVKIRIRRVGICGSDVHIYKGSNPFTVYPRVIGHEMAGEVLEASADVEGFRPGERVTVDPVCNCGDCDACRRGHPNVCSRLEVMGVHVDGGCAEELIVPAANLYGVPDDLPWNRAVMVEPFSIGANVCDRTAVGPGDRVLVVGSGVIGNTVLLTAKMLGAWVAACDIDGEKLARAKELGADAVINSAECSLQEEAARLTRNEGMTVVIDAACLPSLFQPMLECAAPGGRVGILGFSKDVSPVNQFEITRKELTIVGSRLNNRMFPRVIQWFAQEKLKPEALIDEVRPFAEVRQVMEKASSPGGMKGKNLIAF